jgi:hypothetical protein
VLSNHLVSNIAVQKMCFSLRGCLFIAWVLYVVVSISISHLVVAVGGHVGPKVIVTWPFIGLSNSPFKQGAVKLVNARDVNI